MFKSKLQEYCQSKALNLPVYSTTKEGLGHCPRFKATVTVNGSTFSTPDFSRSSKEAQNMVAELAFHHLTGSLSGNSALPVTPSSTVVHQPSVSETLQAASVCGLNSPKGNDKNFKEMAHLCKNQLQIYAQKRNLPLPMYTSECDGPPHACRFRSKVTLEGKTYECPDYFNTIKEAENAVAKVALMELSSEGIQEEDPAVFKNLLQELAQKEHSSLPQYNTTSTGAPHMPMFVSTVEIDNELFRGQEAKTKKLAEMNAAKVAYTTLKERQVKQKSEPFSPGSHAKDASHSSSPKLQSLIKEESPRRNSPELNLSCTKGTYQKDAGSEPVKVSFDIAQSTSGQDSPCSSSASVQPASMLDLYIESSSSEPNTTSFQKKIQVYPWMPNMTFPPGINVLHMDEKWVAVTTKPT